MAARIFPLGSQFGLRRLELLVRDEAARYQQLPELPGVEILRNSRYPPLRSAITKTSRSLTIGVQTARGVPPGALCVEPSSTFSAYRLLSVDPM